MNKYELSVFKTNVKEHCCKTELFVCEEFVLRESFTDMLHTKNSKNFKSLQLTATNLLLVQLWPSVSKIGENKSAVYFTTSYCLIVEEIKDFFFNHITIIFFFS